VRNRLRGEREFVMRLIAISPQRLTIVDPIFQNDTDFIRDEVAKNLEVLQYASHNVRNNKDFILELVAKNAEVLQYASPELKNGGLRRYIGGILCPFSLNELMESSKKTHRLDFDANKYNVIAKEDAHTAYEPKPLRKLPHSLLNAHNEYFAEQFKNHIYSFTGVENSIHDLETVKQAAINMGISLPIEKKECPLPTKTCEEGESWCKIMGGKKRKTRRYKKNKSKKYKNNYH